jgi:hypothetical protein
VALLAHQVAEEMEAAALHTIVPVGADRESRRAPTTTTQTDAALCAFEDETVNPQEFSAQKILEFHTPERKATPTDHSTQDRPTDLFLISPF